MQCPEEAFLPLVGQLVRSVRRGYGTFLTLEFGSPHLVVREPIVASPEAPPRVRKRLARRRVTVAGDWHLWVQYAQWKIQTENYSTASEDADAALIEGALEELDGQRLTSSSEGPEPHSCILRFDLNASLHIRPSSETDDDQWSIYEANGRIASCSNRGEITWEDRQA